MRLLLATTAALALLSAEAVQAQTGSTDVELRQAIARDYDANLGALFDDFHRNPELSGLEVRTAGIMAAQLTALGYDVTTGVGGTSVVQDAGYPSRRSLHELGIWKFPFSI